MGSDVHERNDFPLLRKYRAVIARNVDTPAPGESFLDGVIIEKRVMRLFEKETLSLYKFYTNALRQPVESL